MPKRRTDGAERPRKTPGAHCPRSSSVQQQLCARYAGVAKFKGTPSNPCRSNEQPAAAGACVEVAVTTMVGGSVPSLSSQSTATAAAWVDEWLMEGIPYELLDPGDRIPATHLLRK